MEAQYCVTGALVPSHCLSQDSYMAIYHSI